MRLLVDTHAFLWFITGSEDLSLSARDQITNLDNQVLVSAASLWEMVIKTSLGKMTLARPFEVLIPEQLARNAFEILPIELRHLAALATLPWHHRDPFDRLLVAQALAEGVPLLTKDQAIRSYPIPVLW